MRDGDLYEGTCSPNGINGFGRRFYGNLCQVGYFKSDQLHGNSREYMDGKPYREGWFEFGEFKGPLRENAG